MMKMGHSSSVRKRKPSYSSNCGSTHLHRRQLMWARHHLRPFVVVRPTGKAATGATHISCRLWIEPPVSRKASGDDANGAQVLRSRRVAPIEAPLAQAVDPVKPSQPPAK